MVSRHNLRGVADGTLQAFVSRNADVGGYWAIGVLCRLALGAGVTTVVIDLLSGETEPHFGRLARLVEWSRARMDRHVRALGLPEDVVRVARVFVRFEGSAREHAASTRADVGIRVVDDGGRVYERRTVRWCWAHDPARECRSASVITG